MPSLPATITRPASHGAEMLRGALGGWTWGPALAVAKPAILSVLARIETGTLLLVDEPGDQRHVFGQKLSGELGNVAAAAALPRRASTVPRVEIVIKDDAFWMRLFLFADMGFAEAYMLGDFQCQDLTSFFQVRRPRLLTAFPSQCASSFYPRFRHSHVCGTNASLGGKLTRHSSSL